MLVRFLLAEKLVIQLLNSYSFFRLDIVKDTSYVQELPSIYVAQLRKKYENEIESSEICRVGKEDFELWQLISNKMLPSARELCEQLRLVLEPQKCTRLKGDYRTGRRINLKKVSIYWKR